MEYTKRIVADDGTIILAFQGGWCFLSNAHFTPFTRFGVKYLSVHQYMESMKAVHFNDSQAYDAIMASRSVREQSEVAENIKGFNAEEWAKVEEKHMRLALELKLRQNPKILEALKGTHDAVIAVCTCFDNVWGTGLAIDSKLLVNRKMWGQNRLGELLMEFRSEGVDFPF
jgi:ribA/ribD-fused uncharacterized protein